MRRHRDLAAASATAVLCALVVLIVPLEAVRLIAAIPLCVLLPGYAITAAVFAPAPLEKAQTLLLSVGLSLTNLATGALLLHLLPGGVQGESWAGLLVTVVLAGCAIAARRRPAPRPPGPVTRPRRLLGLATRLRPIDGALLAGAGLCVAAALILSWTPLPAENAVGYTQLWALPAESSARPGVRVGVNSAESEPLAYRLEVHRPGGGPPVSSRLLLEPGQESVRFVDVENPPPGGVRVTALLYRDDDPGVVYRRVTQWVQGV